MDFQVLTPAAASDGALQSYFRNSERILLAYFALAAVRAVFHGHVAFASLDMCILAMFFGLAATERRIPRLWTSVLRDWAPMPLLLVAYFNADWAAGSIESRGYEHQWILLDHAILRQWGLRAAIESMGAFLPSVLELCYLVLYAVPPVLIGVLYLNGRRRQVDRYLTTLFLGALTAYALLPLFPSITPRVFFPDQDLPSTLTFFRRANLWLLNGFDIQASVFPSGHVAVAFSAAFGFQQVLPERRWLGRLLVVFAVLVWVNTVYARYHYAVDGLAGLFIALSAVWASRRFLDS